MQNWFTKLLGGHWYASHFGPWLLESVYEKALLVACHENSIKTTSQIPISVGHLDTDLGTGFRADMIIEEKLLIECKAVENILPIHLAQTLTYLKLLSFRKGLILNFNTRTMKSDIKRVINQIENT